jgi:hypothetical protein
MKIWVDADACPAVIKDILYRADQRIVEEASSRDLVITADIPLAARAIAKGAHVLDPQGELLDAGTIQERLTSFESSVNMRHSYQHCTETCHTEEQKIG